jgi:CPA1 family monovalent cation:H+ antiporter
MLRSVDNYQVEVLISLALAAGGYALAEAIHVSAPIAMVVAGLLIGNRGRALAMSPHVCEHLDTFWELVDEILNAVLFLLIGLEALVLTFTGQYLLAGALLIPIVLLARLAAVGVPASALALWQPLGRGAVPMLTWGGLRGGISVALALSLPATLGGSTDATTGAVVSSREVIVAVTYVIVVFSIIVQGLTVAPLARRLWPTAKVSGASAR